MKITLLDDAKYIQLPASSHAVEMKQTGFWHSRSSHQWEGEGIVLPPLDRGDLGVGWGVGSTPTSEIRACVLSTEMNLRTISAKKAEYDNLTSCLGARTSSSNLLSASLISSSSNQSGSLISSSSNYPGWYYHCLQRLSLTPRWKPFVSWTLLTSLSNKKMSNKKKLSSHLWPISHLLILVFPTSGTFRVKK